MEHSPSLGSLPIEVQSRIISFLDTPSLLFLTQASKHWHHIIDDSSQDGRIYKPLIEHTSSARDFSVLDHESTSFDHYYAHVRSWKDLLRRQTLLARNWSKPLPSIRESVVLPFQPTPNNNDSRMTTWRFRPDFQRRLILATGHSGGLVVTDMDSGATLWSLGEDQVRPHAHLEYSNGCCAFDRSGNTIEVWRHDERHRGTFEQVSLLRHDVETRGFQMLWPTLCVVSSQGRGFVYDLSALEGPQLTQEMRIARGVVGHIEQSPDDIVMYCMGDDGYDFHAKSTGVFLGTLNPSTFTAAGTYHIRHKHDEPLAEASTSTQQHPLNPFLPSRLSQDQELRLLTLEAGSNPTRRNLVGQNYLSLEGEEWGAGVLRGQTMVGISKGGRCMLCLDWPGAIRSSARAAATTYLLELEINDITFQIGGWLGMQPGPPGPTRVIFEVDDKIYVLRLKADLRGVLNGSEAFHDVASVFATVSTGFGIRNLPVSFMGVYDDCIMHTFGMSVRSPGSDSVHLAKGIRVMSFAPRDDEGEGEEEQSRREVTSREIAPG